MEINLVVAETKGHFKKGDILATMKKNSLYLEEFEILVRDTRDYLSEKYRLTIDTEEQ